MQADDRFPTRRSLLSRLKNWDDQEAWQRFYDTYRRLLFSTALRAGLSDDDAEEVVQETVAAVCQKMKDFKYDPATASFKTWLQQVTRNRIADRFRKESRRVATVALPEPEEGTATEPIQQIADPASLEEDARWDEDWQKNLLAAALERVKQEVNPKRFQTYDFHVVQGNSVAATTQALGVNSTQVYLAKYHVGKALKRAVAELRENYV